MATSRLTKTLAWPRILLLACMHEWTLGVDTMEGNQADTRHKTANDSNGQRAHIYCGRGAISNPQPLKL
jgi:hypothetical protein